ncbi:hypothetical protein DM02DRAFT_529513 [Periconia macrospinosa]|uniref:WDR59/RTC1-like RING zinc finger domain-containing protein n=1 Tax=Periconia macrospinosa TaxID=97972 RepID=A0A2V1DM03_9PLEO|nr:hypothetical protein DM02DRAFT_529513 [Periconia macrospinosa]
MAGPTSPFQSPTFDKDVKIAVNEEYTAASISPSGRDVVLAGTRGILIIDLDNPYSPPRYIRHRIGFEVADVQWSPFASRAEWIASTNNNKAIIFNLNIKPSLNEAPIQFTLDSHQGNITDINFSAHHPDVLATCALDTYVYTWDLRAPSSVATSLSSVHRTPSLSFADWQGGATQIKWNRKNEFILASSHDRYVQVWDIRHGARPISTIHAHFNKVYGIDWHRSEPTKILTCSLDKTIKQWDNVGLVESISNPSRTIFTEYPLLRARHTPFPNGIIAMPQHGSASLGLYPQKPSDSESTIPNKPAHVFENNAGPARLHEFLWRSRGSFDDGFDNREFQLVTWATDHQLRLHSIDSQMLKQAVAYIKGGPMIEQPSTSRMGAQYITFRDGPAPSHDHNRPNRSQDGFSQTGTLSSLFKNHRQVSASSLLQAQPKRATMTARTVRRDPTQRVVNHVTWMHSVNIEDRKLDQDGKATNQTDTQRHEVAQEIAAVGTKYPNLEPEKVDLSSRQSVITFKGPWGDYENALNQDQTQSRKPVFLRLRIGFPEGYPNAEDVVDGSGESFDREIHPLDITFEKTTAAITPAMLDHLKTSLDRIARAYAYQGRPALDAVFTYALGESSLDHIIAQAKDSETKVNVEPEPGHLPGLIQDHDNSSEEDEDSDPGEFTNDLMNSSHSNANIPLPAHTVAKFSSPGFLVTTRVPSIGSTTMRAPSIFTADALRLPRNLRQNAQKDDIFETFGRITAGHGSDSPDSSVSWESSTSPSSSSGSDSETEARFRNFLPPLPWQKVSSGLHTKASVPSSIDPPQLSKRSVITVLESPVAQFIPSKKILAEEYLIFGDGPSVCSHNADVARKHGYNDLADIWQLCMLVLNNQVPLDILPQQHRREQILVLARRALVRIKRKDSGLDLQFDEADPVTNPKLKGRIKWGHHSVVTHLIPALFDYFERLADTQMLAMLSCIFSEPAAREGVPNTMAKMAGSHLPMSMEAPAFSLDYFSSPDAAWSLFKPTIQIPLTPAYSRYATPVNELSWYRLSKNLDTYGSHGSSNGPWGSDTLPSEPVTPYSTGNTPPNLSRASTTRAATTTNTPYSTSPEQSHTTARRAPPTGFSNALANLGKTLISSSPPVKTRTDDLSTSAPTSGVTWGTNTFYSSGSQERNLVPPRSKHTKRASFGQAERLNIDCFSDSDSEYDALVTDAPSQYMASSNIHSSDADDQSHIKVTLKNQDQFDDEACVSAPLLDMSKEWLYRAWREQYAEMLGCWGLVSKRAEVLKFNGLIAYFPSSEEPSRITSKAGSVQITLKEEDEEDDVAPELESKSHTTTLAPPSRHPSIQSRRSPLSSPRHFSLNPEAMEFKPSFSYAHTEELSVPPPESLALTEQYLRLSIPTPTVEPSTDFFTVNTPLSATKFPPSTPRLSRPSLSRGQSNISGHSHSSTPRNPSVTTSPQKPKPQSEPIYTCTICWIRVTGRFYLCMSCRHIAHFKCMDSSLGVDEGECVVGCGCGCGFEGEDERDKIERFIEGVRSWDEQGGWLPEVEFDEEASTKAFERVGESKKKEEKKSGGGKEKTGGKGKRKARLTGKSYF